VPFVVSTYQRDALQKCHNHLSSSPLGNRQYPLRPFAHPLVLLRVGYPPLGNPVNLRMPQMLEGTKRINTHQPVTVTETLHRYLACPLRVLLARQVKKVVSTRTRMPGCQCSAYPDTVSNSLADRG